MGSGGLPDGLSQARILRTLKRLGCEENGTGKGSHVGVTAPNGQRTIVMDASFRPLELRTLLKQLEISPEDFLRQL